MMLVEGMPRSIDTVVLVCRWTVFREVNRSPAQNLRVSLLSSFSTI